MLNVHSVQHEVWGSRKSGNPGVLNDYELKQLEHEKDNVTFVEKKFGEQVVGKVYRLDNEELKKTDDYNTNLYKREKVKLDGFEGFVEVYVKA